MAQSEQLSSVHAVQTAAVKFYLRFQELDLFNQLAKAQGVRQEMLVREWVLEKLQLG